MSNTSTICSLPSCKKPINTTPIYDPVLTSFFGDPWFACPYCRDVPVKGSPGLQNSVTYCSNAHRIEDADNHRNTCLKRKDLRCIDRTAQINALVFGWATKYAWAARYVVESFRSDNELQVYCRMRLSAQDIRQEGQENGLDYRDVVAAASSGKAAWAITLSTPLICWLLQDLDVELLSWDSVPAIARPTSLHVRGYDQIYPPTNHPFITIEPKRYPIAYDGIVIDLSAPQHGYTCPIEHQESYFPHRVHCGISYEFSRQYKAHICNLREHRSAADKTEDILLEAFIRICCNTLHRKITELGADGIDNLFTMNSQYFEVFLKGLSVAVREELYAYQEHIDHVIYDPNDKEGRIQLFAHLDQQGYQAMTKAYDLRCEAMGS